MELNLTVDHISETVLQQITEDIPIVVKSLLDSFEKASDRSNDEITSSEAIIKLWSVAEISLRDYKYAKKLKKTPKFIGYDNQLLTFNSFNPFSLKSIKGEYTKFW